MLTWRARKGAGRHVETGTTERRAGQAPHALAIAAGDKCDNVTFRRTYSLTHHHHDPDHAHPVAHTSLSLLRMSAVERIAIAAVGVVVLWAAVWWAVSQP